MSQAPITCEDVLRCICGEAIDATDAGDCITYWGDGGTVELECPECERTLLVTEKVTRTWEVSEKEVELG